MLLCAAFALSIATEPVEEVAATQKIHADENMSVQILDETEQKDQLPVDEVVEVTFGHVKQSSCRSGWSKYGSRCFMLVHRELSWLDAEKHCIRNGANLASIHNLGEYQFIQEILRGATNRFPRAWIGGSDAIKDFVWLWSDGSGFYFQDWSLGEPNNLGCTEKCLVMNQPDNLLWGDANCEEKLLFICGTKPV